MKDVPKNYVRVTVSVDKQTPKKLEALAKHRGRSMSKIVDLLIQEDYIRIFKKNRTDKQEEIRRKLDDVPPRM